MTGRINWKKAVRGNSRGLRGIIAVGDARYLKRRDLSGGLTDNLAVINRGSAAGGAAPFVPSDADVVTSVAINESGAIQLKGDVTLSEGAGIALTQSGQDIEIAGTVTDDHLVLANEEDEPNASDPVDPAPGSVYGKLSVGDGLLKTILFSGGGNVVGLDWNRSAMLGFRHKQILSANPGSSPYVTFPGISGVTVVSPATPAAADVVQGAAVLFGTLGNQDSDCSLVADTGVTALMWIDWLIALGGMFGVKIITSVRNWWGVFSGDPAGSDTPGVQMAGFRFSTSASDTNWQAVASDGTNISVVDTGVAASTNQILLPMIEFDADAGELNYFIDGNLVATIGGTYVPDSQVNMQFRVQARALGGVPVPGPPNPSFIRNILFGYTGILLR